MIDRTYGQYCGLARALEIVGERWALLVVRDLLLSPKRFSELRRGLPRIPTNILAARLRELERDGVVQRRVLPHPAGGVAYELTAYGRDLEDVILRLGPWGARSLGEPGPDDMLSADSLVLALRATFRPAGAVGLRATFEVRMGDIVVHARVAGRRLDAGLGAATAPDLVIETGPGFRALIAGEIAPDEAIDSGAVRVVGDPELLARFVEAFHVAGSPVAAAS